MAHKIHPPYCWVVKRFRAIFYRATTSPIPEHYQTRIWRQKFLGLLPEVYKRRLYEKKGFGSIFEFAKKLAGVSEEQVRLVLNLEKRFEDKPILKALLVEGTVSVNKLARIVSIANGTGDDIAKPSRGDFCERLQN